MSEIRPLAPDEFTLFVDIVTNAYPGWKIEDKEKITKRLIEINEQDSTVAFYGLFRRGRLLGGMRLHNFRMNFFNCRIDAGGVGLIAVHLLHKKERVAKEMVEFFLHHYRAQGAPLALLYPFRPDFYHQMGFGLGSKINQYRVPPNALPRSSSKAHVRYLDARDQQALGDCYARTVDRTHGMIEKSANELRSLLKQHVVGYEKDGRIEGYLAFTFAQGENWLINDIQVQELVYENRETLLELVTFLHTQFDQIRHIIINTHEEFFHYLLLDPRNSSNNIIPPVYHESNVQGTGIMYRVIDVPAALDILANRDWGGQTCCIRLTIRDTFLPENGGRWLLQMENGELQMPVTGEHEVELQMDIAEFSALLIGAVDFHSLYRYGLADVSDPAFVPVLGKAFAAETRPVCTTQF
ncbi:MAG: GNAT family N-acetyltransferase [Anaerolineae bacterium]|nr:GNAT family N-acetyltransferase [Anaerolineae bacterium]